VKEIAFTSAAVRQWRKLTAATRVQIDRKLTAFAETGVGDVNALKGVAGMRLRVGDWRVLFTIDADTITIHAVGHRRDIYDRGHTMTKSSTAKNNVQFIHTPDGSDLAVLPRADYDRLIALAADAQEDAAASRIVRSSSRAIKEGREVVLPKVVADRLVGGESPVRVIREWRGMIQGELAVAVGISQNYLSGIETGRRKGPAELQKKFARALGVPVDLLID
jgi:mRNA-degrading endonuclease RelE of RelBE toxin-antitoxin system/DNA-binding XRE family transcriptional regulator